MKKLLPVLAIAAVALPIAARPSRALRMKTIVITSPQTESVASEVVAHLIDQWKSARNDRSGTLAVTDIRSSRALVIPAAGSTAGGGGALFFRSDVTLVNYEQHDQDVVALWWPAGSTNTLTVASGTRLTLKPSTFATYHDFVATVLNKSGLGAIAILPVTGSNFDFDNGIDAFSRIFTKQPGSEGTVSQEFSAVDPDSLSIFTEGVAMGLEQDAAYRTNFGIVNAENVAHKFHVTFIGETQTQSTDVTVPAFGMIQQSMPTGDFGAVNIVFNVTDTNNFISWIAFASSTDNITGDGWVSIASADYSSDDLAFFGY